MPDSPFSDPLELLDAKQVSDLFKIPTDVVYRDAQAGRLPSVLIGRRRRFRRTDLEDLLAREAG